MADGHYWTEREAYMTLRLHPSRTAIPLRSCVLKATGLLFLLHFLFIGAPIPNSHVSFSFFTLFDGRRMASKFDLDFLAQFISANSLSLIKRIESVPLDKPLYTSQSDDCIEYQYLLNITDVDPTMISTRCSQDEHDGVCSSVISFVTLGSVDIEHHPDFLALVDGFNASVDAFGGQERLHHILEWFATPCRELIMAAFDRQIKAPEDVHSHIESSQTNPENDVWDENGEIVELITRFVTHYLTEPGHPADPDQVVNALNDDDDDPTDPLLGAKLFLSVLTGSTLLRIKPTWKVKCLITHDWSQDYPTTDADGREDYGPDVTISFCACFKTFSITNNARLRLLLLCEVPEPVGGSAINAAALDQFTQATVMPFDQDLQNPANLRFSSLADWNSFHYNLFDHDCVLPLNEEDTATFLELMGTSQSSPENDSPSSPSFPLAPISDTLFDPLDRTSPSAGFQSAVNQPSVHSPRAVYPASRSIAANSSFGLAPAFTSSTSSTDGVETDFNSRFGSNSDFHAASAYIATAVQEVVQHSSTPAQIPSVPQIISLPTIQPPPGRGSLADLRMRRAQTPAPNLAAIYLGLPFQHNHARLNVLSEVAVCMWRMPSVPCVESQEQGAFRTEEYKDDILRVVKVW
ncbi:hypothetical protein B0H11DRAFT_2224065 [Mycena galericulata]|nr:hypothetical protein B0H11DRAFT_2224065 [Mycena galericulata]